MPSLKWWRRRVQEGARSTPVLQPENPLPDLAGLMKDDLKRRASGAFFAGDLRTAALASDRLRQKYPNDPAGWYWAVRANQKLSVAALARAGEVEPDSPRIHALLGDVYRRRRHVRRGPGRIFEGAGDRRRIAWQVWRG